MFTNNFNFELLTRVRSGPNSINNVYQLLKEKNYKKIGLVLDENLYKNSNYIKNFLKQFRNKKVLKKILYFNGTNEPTYQYLDLVISELKKKGSDKFDCLIAIGGGSTIDFTKGIATLLKNSGSGLKYKGFPKNLNSSIPIVAVPSTTGSGAELAYNAVFIDTKSRIKLGINTKNNYPILSILDPKIIVNSPKNVILNSSLGALVRSIDTMFNKKSSKVSTIFSENSYKLAAISDLIIGKQTSIMEEAMAADKKVIYYDNENFLSTLDYVLNKINVVEKDFEGLKRRIRYIFDNKYDEDNEIKNFVDQYLCTNPKNDGFNMIKQVVKHSLSDSN